MLRPGTSIAGLSCDGSSCPRVPAHRRARLRRQGVGGGDGRSKVMNAFDQAMSRAMIEMHRVRAFSGPSTAAAAARAAAAASTAAALFACWPRGDEPRRCHAYPPAAHDGRRRCPRGRRRLCDEPLHHARPRPRRPSTLPTRPSTRLSTAVDAAHVAVERLDALPRGHVPDLDAVAGQVGAAGEEPVAELRQGDHLSAERERKHGKSFKELESVLGSASTCNYNKCLECFRLCF